MSNLQLTIVAIALTGGVLFLDHLFGDLAARVGAIEATQREQQP